MQPTTYRHLCSPLSGDPLGLCVLLSFQICCPAAQESTLADSSGSAGAPISCTLTCVFQEGDKGSEDPSSVCPHVKLSDSVWQAMSKHQLGLCYPHESYLEDFLCEICAKENSPMLKLLRKVIKCGEVHKHRVSLEKADMYNNSV